MFNQQLKNRFLAQYNEDSAKVYRNSLMKIDEIETQYNKDIFNFTYEELDEALQGITSKTQNGMFRIVSAIRQYMEWANQEGFVKSKMVYSKLLTVSKLNDFIWDDGFLKTLITRDELFLFCDKIENAIDKAIIVLAFEGIDGMGHYEMRSLKKTDVDFDSGIINITTFNKTNRTVVLKDKRSLDVLQEAINQKAIRTNGKNSIRELVETQYILRKSESNNPFNDNVCDENGDNMVTKHYPTQRATRIFKGKYSKDSLTDFEKDPYIFERRLVSLATIFKSGYFDYCKQLEQEKQKELEIEDYKSLCVRFGISKTRAYTYKREYLQFKTLENLR